MAGLKPAKVTKFFVGDAFSDKEVVSRLKVQGITVVPYGPGGYPTCNVFHAEDGTWIGSRLDILDVYDTEVLAFFSEREDDPIFAAMKIFAAEITGAELEALTSILAKAKHARDEKEGMERIARVQKTRTA